MRSRHGPRGARGHARRRWEPWDDDLLRETFADTPSAEVARWLVRTPSSVYQRARKLGLRKSAAYLASPLSGRLRPGAHIGGATRFTKGHAPHNKGLHRPGYSVGRGRMQETQFKKGERRGVAAKLWKPIGTERISKDGYLERKINNDLPLQARWRAVHLILWESANGPLPRGRAVAFKNGDKADIRLGNLERITRSELMLRNTVHNLPKPVAQAVQLLGALKRKINRRTRHEEQNRGPAQPPVRRARRAIA